MYDDRRVFIADRGKDGGGEGGGRKREKKKLLIFVRNYTRSRKTPVLLCKINSLTFCGVLQMCLKICFSDFFRSFSFRSVKSLSKKTSTTFTVRVHYCAKRTRVYFAEKLFFFKNKPTDWTGDNTTTYTAPPRYRAEIKISLINDVCVCVCLPNTSGERQKKNRKIFFSFSLAEPSNRHGLLYLTTTTTRKEETCCRPRRAGAPLLPPSPPPPSPPPTKQRTKTDNDCVYAYARRVATYRVPALSTMRAVKIALK